jgi:CRISPR/Cas system CSM-associated protein Csm5 (group 7 of RAMP superfamily)
VAKELFQQLPEVLRRDGEKTVRAMAEWAEKIVPSMQWTTVTPKARSWLFPLGWGTGWLAHTIGPVLSPDERRALANRLKLGRGQAPKSVPFPRSMKVARVPVGDRTQEVPLGLVSVQFTPLCQAGIRE